MRYIEPLSEHEMVAAFLRAEISSERFGQIILDLLRRNGRGRRIVDEPDTSSAEENGYRMRLLGDFRGYRQRRELFKDFPDAVSWHRYALSRDELARVKYMDYSYWNELSGGTRAPIEAARNVRAGMTVFGQSTAGFLDAARALACGAKFHELILVSTDAHSELVVLEGHVRLTAYFLAPECVPEELTTILGLSPEMGRWMSL